MQDLQNKTRQRPLFTVQLWLMNVNENFSFYTVRGKTIPVSHYPPLSTLHFSWILQQATDLSHHSSFSVLPSLLPSLVPSIFTTRVRACVTLFVSHPRNLRSWLLSTFLITLDLSCLFPSTFHAVKLSSCLLSVHDDSARWKQIKDKLKKESNVYVC